MNQDFVIKNDILKKYQGSEQTVNIPCGVRRIAENAFRYHVNLLSVSIPDSVTTIGDSAFEGCANLLSVSIPDSVICIGDSAFSRCLNLLSVNLPDSVTCIGRNAFYQCISLTSVRLPSNLKSIGASAFYNTPWFRNYPDDFIMINKILIAYHGYDHTVTIPDSVTSIGSCAFRECTSPVSVIIPDSVTSIGNASFGNCPNLRSVSIPDSVTSIGNYVFYHCKNLKSLTIPESVTNIGYWIFDDCKNLDFVKFHQIMISMTHAEKSSHISDIVSILSGNENQSRMPDSVKYAVLWKVFQANADKKETAEYMKKHSVQMLEFLIAENDVKLFQKILASGKFITEKNIDLLIRYAIEHQKYEIQITLTEYKNQKNWYQEIDKKLKL